MKFLLNKIFISLLLATLTGLTAVGQQKETIVDFSSKQKPDTIYNNQNKGNAVSIVVNEALGEQAKTNISSPSLDSLKRELIALRKEVDNNKNVVAGIQTNLFKSHKKFKLGMLLLIGGTIASSLGNAIFASTNPGTPVPQEAALLVLGGFGATVTGIVFIFNSNKYLGKAGKTRGERYGAYRTSVNYY